MRGKETQAVPNIKTSRITPAYAGKSTFSHVLTPSKKGSPPPMRGKD